VTTTTYWSMINAAASSARVLFLVAAGTLYYYCELSLMDTSTPRMFGTCVVTSYFFFDDLDVSSWYQTLS
jgi:hypothetical protein